MNNKYQHAAKLRGAARSAEIEQKVKTAMETITAEMNGNGGIYPANGGAISKNEIARRAGINLTTLFSSKQKVLGEEVTRWVNAIKKKEVVGRTRVRRTFIERADDWKKKYLALQNSLIAAELELQAANAERDEAKADVRKLHAENAALLAQMRAGGASNVSPIPKKN